MTSTLCFSRLGHFASETSSTCGSQSHPSLPQGAKPNSIFTKDFEGTRPYIVTYLVNSFLLLQGVCVQTRMSWVRTFRFHDALVTKSCTDPCSTTRGRQLHRTGRQLGRSQIPL